MVEPVQRVGSVPAPDAGATDQTPSNPTTVSDRPESEISEEDRRQEAESFADYLNRSSILNLEKNKPGGEFDPAREIASSSVYGQPDDKKPI